jgi:hypothetical protein
MGLDVLEIIMSCEDAFDVRIADKDVESVRTAGDLHALVMRLLHERQGAAGCPSSRVFYRLRRGLMKVGVARMLIHPDMRLGEIVGELGQPRWAEVRAALEIPPLLRRPGWAELIVLGGAIASGVGRIHVERPLVGGRGGSCGRGPSALGNAADEDRVWGQGEFAGDHLCSGWAPEARACWIAKFF